LADYILFKQALELIKHKKHLTHEGLEKIINIKASMNLGLSYYLKAAFPNTIPQLRPWIENKKIEYPNWISVFASAEGNFLVNIQKFTTHKLENSINQDSLLLNIVEIRINGKLSGFFELRNILWRLC